MTFRDTRSERNSPETSSRSDTFCQDHYGRDADSAKGTGIVGI